MPDRHFCSQAPFASDKAMTQQAYFLPPHGGDRDALVSCSEHADEELIDFSVNVRPDGPPEYLRLAMLRALDEAGRYPAPDSAPLRRLCAQKTGLSEDSVVFGNGTSELLHALAHVLAKSGIPCVVIPEPAFGDYERACRLAGLKTLHPSCSFCAPSAPHRLADWKLPVADILASPKNCAVIIANPGNPAGTYLAPKALIKLFQARSDITWIIDEAFLSYAGPEEKMSVLPWLARKSKGEEESLPKDFRWCLVRSLTKFHALAGIRAGCLLGSPELMLKIREELPTWNVSCIAQACIRAILEKTPEAEKDERKTRSLNRQNRRCLLKALQTLPLIVFRSQANFLLVRLNIPHKDLAVRLLKEEALAVRDCATYQGLKDGRWFRIAVRGMQDTDRLVAALRKILVPQAPFCSTQPQKRHTPALMLQGTSSGAGKSVLTAAFCRILRQEGCSVAPFKAQNMSLNSGVTWDGLEMGRAQILQAEACGIQPDVRMNPLLLKPLTDKGSQVILMGRPHSVMQARDFLSARRNCKKTILEAYASLAGEHDVMVLEGAGAMCEVNLKESDLVNMAMAKAAGAHVLLTGDIDKGGVYGAFLGAWMTCTQEERKLLAGYLVNRFRGDASLLAPAHDYMMKATGIPVLGVIPYLAELNLPEEDSVGLSRNLFKPATLADPLDVAMVVLGRTANYTDAAPLGAEPDVTLRPVKTSAEWGNPDLVILPGSRSVAEDCAILRTSGLAGRILEHASKGGWIIGICGGMQIMGDALHDPMHLESGTSCMEGLHLLPLATTLEEEKTLTRISHAATPFGVKTSGYEIHHGQTRITKEMPGMQYFSRPGSEDGPFLGCACGHMAGTYLHGLFDDDHFRRAFLDTVRQSLGKKAYGKPLASWNPDAELDRLADTVRSACDIKAILRILGL